MIIFRGGVQGRGTTAESRDKKVGSARHEDRHLCRRLSRRGHRLAGKWPREMAWPSRGRTTGMSSRFIVCKNKPSGLRRMQGIYIEQLHKQLARRGMQSGPHGKPLILIFSPRDKRRQGPPTTAQPSSQTGLDGLSVFSLSGTDS